ncbi:hypothetical protein [Pseudoduganella sp. RAF53_2]|uniref:hypothetical protein n=1 Tax=unclassified Pseudoduganella TaxID=2637179 RepID=UPI003F9D5C0C
MTQVQSEEKKILAPRDGGVIATVEPDVSEREISEDRDAIVARLHGSYLHLMEQMSEFQQQWDENPTMAFMISAKEGWNAGGAEWLSDQAELFEKATWVNLGNKLQDAAGTGYDRLATYSKERYEALKAELNRHVENPEDTLYNWAWWQASIERTATSYATQKLKELEASGQHVVDTARNVLASADKAQKIYRHRDAIMGLPTLIANGDPRPVQAFVDTVLMDIDPELAKAIRTDPNFPVVLELIADHDSALSYLSYAGLMLEGIPPNFYAYAAGKGGAYLMIEVVMLVITALLSAGTAAAARIGMLAARFATASAKVASLGKRLKRAKAAIDAFVRVLQDLSDAVDDLHALGAKLLRARSKGLVVRGRTKTTLQAKKAAIKRDKRCRCCGSTQHTTPRFRMGTVEYR